LKLVAHHACRNLRLSSGYIALGGVSMSRVRTVHGEKESVSAVTSEARGAIRFCMQRRIGQCPVYGSTILPELAGSCFEVFWIRFKPIHVWTGGKDESN
jgi:hypothetical protein